MAEVIPQRPAKCDVFVYLIELFGFHKIGQTINVPRRCRALDVGPVPLRLVHQFASREAYADEQHLHQRYEAKRVRGEWFRLDDTDVQMICRIAEGPIVAKTPQQSELERLIAVAERRLRDHVRTLMDASNAPDAEIAQLARMSDGELENFLAGRADLSWRHQRSLAAALGVHHDVLHRSYVILHPPKKAACV